MQRYESYERMEGGRFEEVVRSQGCYSRKWVNARSDWVQSYKRARRYAFDLTDCQLWDVLENRVNVECSRQTEDMIETKYVTGYSIYGRD